MSQEKNKVGEPKTATQKFVEQYAQWKVEYRAVDIKFSFRPTHETTAEDVFSDLLEMLDDPGEEPDFFGPNPNKLKQLQTR